MYFSPCIDEQNKENRNNIGAKMNTLEAKPFDQNAENWKRQNRLFTSTVLQAGASGQNQIGTHALRSQWTVWFVFTAQTLVSSVKISQHTSHNGIFVKRFARIFLRLHQLQIDGKTVTIATESVDFMDLTDTNPENNWYQFYTNYKWIGTKWKAYRLLVLSLDIDFVK